LPHRLQTERDDDLLVTDREFAKSVAKGITLIASSGDDGGGRSKQGVLTTNYPPSSTYVLGVGGCAVRRLSLCPRSLTVCRSGLWWRDR
jgi:subtilase family serine protease